MNKYLSMKECFGDVRREDWLLFSSAEYSHCIEIAECSSGVIAEEILHAINSHDELVAMNKDLFAALEAVIEWYDMESDHTIEPDFYKRMAACQASEDMAREAIAKAKAAS